MNPAVKYLCFCLTLLLACESERPAEPAAGGEAASNLRPSILLFVMDTTRMDAVSAYGMVDGTTPVTDRLARDGLLYRNAFASAPWTLPSHATLFTGRLPSDHGVGARNPRAPDSLVTLAERMRDAGYDTYGVSENPWIDPTFNLDQGFDRFVSLIDPSRKEGAIPHIEAWWRERDPARPFFLFVNVADSHTPYTVRPENPWLPEGVDLESARRVKQRTLAYMCDPQADRNDFEILRGLYHGDVAAADAKLGEVLRVLEREAGERPVIQVVTSDHGEHFGEADLVGHLFSIRNPLLHVPLVVHGLPGAKSAVIDTPVQLADLVPSILEWTGAPAAPELDGRVLPTQRGPSPQRVLLAEFGDPASGLHDDQIELARKMIVNGLRVRRRCDSSYPVRGDMQSALAYPFKLNAYEFSGVELYDLSSDPMEERNVAAQHTSTVRELQGAIQAMKRRRESRPGPSPENLEVSDEVYQRLRELGYLEDTADPP